MEQQTIFGFPVTFIPAGQPIVIEDYRSTDILRSPGSSSARKDVIFHDGRRDESAMSCEPRQFHYDEEGTLRIVGGSYAVRLATGNLSNGSWMHWGSIEAVYARPGVDRRKLIAAMREAMSYCPPASYRHVNWDRAIA